VLENRFCSVEDQAQWYGIEVWFEIHPVGGEGGTALRSLGVDPETHASMCIRIRGLLAHGSFVEADHYRQATADRRREHETGRFVVAEPAMSDWNSAIIEEFRSNEGKVREFEGFSVILLHHVGAKSGAERVNPVVCYPQSDGQFAIMASNGGAATNPDWYYNLKAHPEIKVELGTAVFSVAVRELEGRERETVWADASNAQLEASQQRTTRTFPVLLLTRIS
jgi:deazaflavin-dependent oxidoreductase (nitroreductase family)